MRIRHKNKRSAKCRTAHFGARMRRFATRGWIISAGALLAVFPCLALPPGVLYSTTVPYSVPYGTGTELLTALPNISVVTTDAPGNSYVAGSIYANGLASTPGVVQPAYAGGACPDEFGIPVNACPDAFIAKFDPNGMLLFLTYLGGTGSDIPYFLALDNAGNIYVAGQTNSTDFPLAGAPWRPVLSDEGTFVAKLSGNGKTLIWSTVLNGALLQLSIAPDGTIYYLAQTTATASGQVSTTVALTELNHYGQFVATVNVPSGTGAVAVGADGSVYIGGLTATGSDVTPTAGAWRTTYNGGTDGFVAQVSASLSGFTWLTLAGGSEMDSEADDNVSLIQPAPDGTLWIAGYTNESDFPVLPGAWQSSPRGSFLVHLSADGSNALAATYLPAGPSTIALDGSGNVIFSALDGSGFPATPGAPWPCAQLVAGSPGGFAQGFFGKIDAAGQLLLWGTWNGPSVPGGPAAVNADGDAIVAGSDNQGDVILSAVTTVPGPPALVESCIAPSGYPFLSGPLAAGELISIYGAGFGPEQGVTAQASGNTIGTELGGVQVLIEGAPAPLIYVSSAQINLVTPYLLNGRNTAHIQIVTASAASNEVVLGVQAAAPEIFVTQESDDISTAAILNQDNTVNSQGNPAHVGDTVAMFASGVGQTNPPGVDGEIPQAAGGTPVLPIMVQLMSAGTASPSATVTYAGNAPGLVSGVTQVNFQVPSVNRVGAGPSYPAWIVLYAGETPSGPVAEGPVIWFE